MKKSNSIKLFSILLIVMLIALFIPSISEANNTGFSDLTNTLTNSNVDLNNVDLNGVDLNNIDVNAVANSLGNNTANNSLNSISNSATKNNTSKNNTSIYNNTSNLPKTGIEDSAPVAILLVVFAISSVYAYRKIKEYRNI